MRTEEELVGRAVVVEVAEPWDFSSAAGKNLLTGTVIAIHISRDWGPCLIVDTRELLSQDDVSGTCVRLTARYVGDNILDISHGGDVMGNGSLIPDSGSIVAPTSEQIAKGVRLIAGSVKLA